MTIDLIHYLGYLSFVLAPLTFECVVSQVRDGNQTAKVADMNSKNGSKVNFEEQKYPLYPPVGV